MRRRGGATTPRGCAPEVSEKLVDLLLQHAPALLDLELMAACSAEQPDEYVLIVKRQAEYAVVAVRAPSASPEALGLDRLPGDSIDDEDERENGGVIVLRAFAFHSSMRFTQPDRQTVTITYEGQAQSFRMGTDLHAAILLCELGAAHGIVSRQGLMAGLSGYVWLKDLFLGPSPFDLGAGGGAAVGTGGNAKRADSSSAISYWAPEGGWVVPPVSEADGSSAMRESRSGFTTLEDAVTSARAVRMVLQVRKIMNSLVKTRTFVSQMVNFTFKSMEFVLKSMDFVRMVLQSDGTTAAGSLGIR